MEEKNIMKTGTTTVGIVCKDGIVLAADKRATAGNLIASKKALKLQNITDNIAVTMAGTVSDAQLLIRLVQAEMRLKRMRTGQDVFVKETANLMARMVYNNIRKMSMIPGIAHFLMGGKDKDGTHIYEIFADGSIQQIDDFIGSGSGSVMAYGVLETMWNKNLSVEEGVKMAVQSINAALQRDSASGNGIDVVTVTSQGLKKVIEKELITKIEV
ncbi:MAG: proteasome subunit beta [Candidatus Woesearchaeota archaeon]|jgi:proteasome beta subunit|nr:proteasome subunit beta [Candidatus Woesearchaeota archaeon]MDP7457735.1 proteasome subunit beta [Candidatus Woesearchaeota archaeon]